MPTKYILRCLMLCIATIGLMACTTVPITGRRSLNLVPQSQINSMANEQYSQFLSENKLSDDYSSTLMVRRVGRRIQNAVEDYYASRGLSAELSGYDWEFNLIESDEKNAWCMPGGKVVVYEGILPVTQDATGLAVVMGHEIAHAIAQHGNERMSTALLAQLGGTALSVALDEQPENTRKWFLAAYGAGTQVGIMLPYSRQQETEADYLGLIFMAKAGYDPRAAIPFWQRMAADSKGGSMPEFLSTHPASETRIQSIKQRMPEVLRYYQPADASANR